MSLLIAHATATAVAVSVWLLALLGQVGSQPPVDPFTEYYTPGDQRLDVDHQP